MNLAKLAFVSLLSIVAGGGCSQVEHLYDCNHICNRYSQCFDANYNVDDCTNKCKDNANNDSSFADKADMCQSCEDDKSCAGATFECATECVGIVP
jgi:hypothetical protein